MTPQIVSSISERYKELYAHVTGETLAENDGGNLLQRIENSIINSVNSINFEASNR
jgi:phosphoribosylaminoimidazole-succinocarboxamide synthase